MPLRATDNPLVLPVLGLLVEQPRHGYGLVSELRQRYPQLRVKAPSVYTLVRSLQNADWLAADGATGERTTYKITTAGTAELRSRIDRTIRDPAPDRRPEFAHALAYLGLLPRATATAALDDRIGALSSELADLRRAVAAANLPEIFMIEVHYRIAEVGHDIRWLRKLSRRISSGELRWPAAR